ncbi:hypothetical protein D3C78_1011650 [compost metagenome]
MHQEHFLTHNVVGLALVHVETSTTIRVICHPLFIDLDQLGIDHGDHSRVVQTVLVLLYQLVSDLRDARVSRHRPRRSRGHTELREAHQCKHRTVELLVL